MIAALQNLIGTRQSFLKRWLDAAPHYQPWPLLNRMGLQVLRTGVAHGVYALRPVPRSADVAEAEAQLDADGITIIPNFLDDQAFQEVAQAYEALMTEDRAHVDRNRNDTGVTWTTNRVDPGEAPTEHHAAMQRHLIENRNLQRLAEHVLRRKLHARPTLSLQHLHLPEGERDDRDVEGVLHADRHFHCVKMALFINENTPETGPYVYCKGSHKLTRARLRHEREFSVREAKALNDSTRDIDPQLLERGRNRVSDAAWRDMGLEETLCTGAPNTLVVSDNFGFHRRGQMSPGHSRKQVRVLFYYAQRPWYGKLAFWAYSKLRRRAAG